MNFGEFLLNLIGFVVFSVFYWMVLVLFYFMFKEEEFESLKEALNPFYFLEGDSLRDKIGYFILTLFAWLYFSVFLIPVIRGGYLLFSELIELLDFIRENIMSILS